MSYQKGNPYRQAPHYFMPMRGQDDTCLCMHKQNATVHLDEGEEEER